MPIRALLIVNPHATSTTPGGRDVLAAALSSELKLDVAVTTHRGHAAELAEQAARDGFGLVVAHGRPSIYDIGATVNIDGMEVHPGDLLHGDENGITVIPAKIAAEVAAKAQEHRTMEQQRLAEILSADFHKQFEQATQYR